MNYLTFFEIAGIFGNGNRWNTYVAQKTPTLNNNFRKKLGLPSLSVVLVIGSLITLALKATSDSPLAVNWSVQQQLIRKHLLVEVIFSVDI